MAENGTKGHRQKLRERFLADEETSHTDEAILELLLSYAIPQRDIQPLAKALIEKFGNLSNVLAANIEELCKFHGMKLYSAVLLQLIDWIRTNHPKKPEKKPEPINIPKNSSQKSDGEQQLKLFELPTEKTAHSTLPEQITDAHPGSVTSPQRIGIFTNAVLKEAIIFLPTLPDTTTLDEVRLYLWNNLHYNAEQTRQRYARYIIRRMFPDGQADRALMTFARHFREGRDLKDVCFYRFIKAEPIMIQIVEELLIPNIGAGYISREQIRDFLSLLFPSARSILASAQATANALKEGGIAKVDRLHVKFAYRDISIPAFAFILHSEFPDPGMYDITKIETNHIFRAMLWNPDRLFPSLHELKNRGLISKVSDIDNICQFTTRWHLEELVEHLVTG